jgi:aminopeptidase N
MHLHLFITLAGEPYKFNAQACARRAIKNKALALLSTLHDTGITANLLQRFREATNMTDQVRTLHDV